MQIDTFKKIVTTFADPQTTLLWEKEKVLVQVYGEIIETSLKQRSGEITIVDGGNEMPAINWILHRLAKLPLLADRLLSTIPQTKPFITPEAEVLQSLEVKPGSESEHVADALQATVQALDNRSPLETTVLYITSDAGEGKTCLINELARYQAERFKERKADWLVIPIPLGGRHFLRFDDIVVGALVNRYRFPYFYYNAFVELVKLGILVPAFDGFEEMFVENTSGEALSAMGILVSSMQSSGAVIIAARKAYFEFENLKTQSRLHETINGFSVGFGKASLNRWKKRQFIEYCNGRELPDAEELYEKVSHRLKCDHPLVTRPVLVRRLVDIAEKSGSIDEFLTRLQVSGGDFFSVFVRGIIEREATEKWIDRSGEIAQPLLTVDEHCELLALVALEMWQSRVDFLKGETLQFVTDYFSEIKRKTAALAGQIRERIKGHALLVPSPNAQTALEFDHDEFKQYFLGEAIATICGGQPFVVRSELLNILRKGSLPPHTLNALGTALRRYNSKRQSEVATLLCEVATMDGQTTYTHENCTEIIIGLLSGLDGGAITLKKMSFPPESLRDKKLKGITFDDCFFASSSMENSNLDSCVFQDCHLSKLEIRDSTVFKNVSMSKVTVGCINMMDKSVTIYEPSACRAQLAQLGITFLDGAVQIPLPIRRRHPEEATIQFGRVLRSFLRSTHISEGIIRTKLGGNGNHFISDCVPALLNRGIFIEVENRGAGQQRHWKLGRPMAVLDEALENCGGMFSQFLDLASRPDKVGG